MAKLQHQLLAAVAGIALVAGLTGSASAAGAPFTFDTAGLTPAGSYNDGTPPNFLSGDEIDLSGGNLGGVLFDFAGPTVNSNFTFSGVAIGTTVTPPNQGLGQPPGNNFNLDIVVSGTATFTGTVAGQATYSLTTVNWTMYADEGGKSNATAGTLATAPVLKGNGDTLVAVASGTVLNPGSQSVATNTANGINLNAESTYQICAAAGGVCTGNQTGFYVSPNPFYTIADDSWDSTGSNITDGVSKSGDLVVLDDGMTGHFTFVKIPEPASLGLFGAALAGFGVWKRRRKARKA
jgi:hypothetical protein